MSKITAFALLLCAFLMVLSAAPASAGSLQSAAGPRLECGDRAVAQTGNAEKIAFLKSLGFDKAKQPNQTSKRPGTAKLARTECTSDGPMTTCCGSCGCCTWTGDGNGPTCKSWC
jgi:hypothetical protein